MWRMAGTWDGWGKDGGGRGADGVVCLTFVVMLVLLGMEFFALRLKTSPV